jgi:endonuclease/exonuclease/phosphatase family metal-dependent hydrolase
MSRAARFALLLVIASCAGPRARHDEYGFSSKGFGAAWDDHSRCKDALTGKRTAVRKDGVVRVGSWNIKWFPDGKPGNHPDENGGTDIPWLACAIAYLDVDVLALQEVKLTPRAKEAQQELLTLLAELTGGPWSFGADACRDVYRQHVAVLYRTDRVEVSHLVTQAEIDPTTSKHKDPDPACPGNLRPGLGMYVRSKRGGADFHLVNAHLDSGRETRDFDNRKNAWQRFARVFAARQSVVLDDDLIIAGDFNTMGCPDCGLSSPADERRALTEAMAALTPPFAVAETSAQCSQYYRGYGTLLDQVVATRSMREAYGALQLVEGVCARSGCAKLETAQMPVFNRISDHCPVLFDVKDVDDDPDAVSAAPLR